MKKTLKLKLIESNDKAILGDIVQGLDGQKPIILEYLPTNMLPHKVIKPIAISDEEIKVGSSILHNSFSIGIVEEISQYHYKVRFSDGQLITCLNYNCKKIEVTTEQIPDNLKQAIVDGKLKDGDNIEVEYEQVYQPLTNGGGAKIELVLDFNNKAIISIMYSEEECKEMVDEIVRYILHYKFSRNQVPALLVDKWFEENKKK